MRQYLTNKTNSAVFPEVVNQTTKATDTVQIQPRGRVQLKEGWTVDTNWTARNPNAINVFDTKD